MKIGFVLDDSLDPADGVQQYILTLGRWFREQGHDVHYLVGRTTRDDVPNVHSLSRTLSVRFNQNRMATPLPASSRKVSALLAREKFDVLHVQMPYSPFLAAKVINQAPPSTAVIGTFHILPYSRREALATRALRLAVRRSLKRFDKIVSVSQPAAEFAKQTFGVQIDVLPNAVHIERFQKGKKLKEYDDGKLNIVYLGRLVARKGCLHLLEAVKQLGRDDIRVIVIGKGSLLPKLRQFVARNGLDKIVEFAGFVPEDDKPDYLATADIAVLPSTGGESFGIVIVEAMAAGADVVVAGDNPGYRSVLGQAEKQLVKPTDTEAFAATLKHFLQDKAVRRQSKQWQDKEVVAYDVRQVGPKLLKLYRNVLRGKQTVR